LEADIEIVGFARNVFKLKRITCFRLGIFNQFSPITCRWAARVTRCKKGEQAYNKYPILHILFRFWNRHIPCPSTNSDLDSISRLNINFPTVVMAKEVATIQVMHPNHRPAYISNAIIDYFVEFRNHGGVNFLSICINVKIVWLTGHFLKPEFIPKMGFCFVKH
jgi:hypothetical protein